MNGLSENFIAVLRQRAAKDWPTQTWSKDYEANVTNRPDDTYNAFIQGFRQGKAQQAMDILTELGISIS